MHRFGMFQAIGKIFTRLQVFDVGMGGWGGAFIIPGFTLSLVSVWLPNRCTHTFRAHICSLRWLVIMYILYIMMSCSFCPNCALDPVSSISCPLEQVCNTPCCMDPLTTNLPVVGVEHTTFEEFVVNILLYGAIDNKFTSSWIWTDNIWGICSHPMFSSFYLFSTVLLFKWKVQFFRCKPLRVRVIIMFAYKSDAVLFQTWIYCSRLFLLW